MLAPISDPPIVLIHGIKGSQLAQTYDDSFDVVWSGVQNRFESIWDLELDDSGAVDLDPWDMISVMRIEKLAYGELLGRLRKKFRQVPVYIFRYDWRLDLRDTAQKLGQFLGILEQKTGAKEFRIVTHSMGGLILSAFLKLDQVNHLSKIQRTVITAPPFWGSLGAVKTLVVGDTVSFGFNAPEEYRKIARTFPSVYQLVPGYQGAWNHPVPGADIWDIQYWQQRVAAGMGTRNSAIYQDRDLLMGKHLARASTFHAQELLDFDNDLSDAERERFLILYGTGEKTQTKLKVNAQNSAGEIQYFFDFKDSTQDNNGDGTVPAQSALRYKKVRAIEMKLKDYSAWWPPLWDDKAKLQVAGYHGMFLALDKVQGLVCDWFEGKVPNRSWAEPIKP